MFIIIIIIIIVIIFIIIIIIQLFTILHFCKLDNRFYIFCSFRLNSLVSRSRKQLKESVRTPAK